MITILFEKEFEKGKLVVTNNGFYLMPNQEGDLFIDASTIFKKPNDWIEITGVSIDKNEMYIATDTGKRELSFGVSFRDEL